VLADKCREQLKGESHKETRKQLLEQASAIYQAESAVEATARLAAFADTRARTSTESSCHLKTGL